MLGYGAMIIKELPETEAVSVTKGKKGKHTKLLSHILSKINKVESLFKNLCQSFSLYDYRTDLPLGWGLVRGVAKKVNGDFVGANINKCSRLCHIARPFGIVIDSDDFPEIPKKPPYNFLKQVRRLEGIVNEVDVWVTEEIATQFLPREKMREQPEVHVAGLCIKLDNGNIKALIARRNKERALFPNLYEGCGGQLRYSESFVTGVMRHYKTEMNINIEVLDTIHELYLITQPNEPIIPGIKFLCLFIDGSPSSRNHSEVKWVNEKQLRKIPAKNFIPGQKETFLSFINQFKSISDKI